MAIECSAGNIKISTDHYEVVDSGCVIVPFGESLFFDLPGNLKFKVTFEKNPDETKKEVSFNTKTIDNGSVLQLTIYNVSHINFGAPKKNVDLALMGGRLLRLCFSFQSINEEEDKEDRLFFYTWLWKKNDAVEGGV